MKNISKAPGLIQLLRRELSEGKYPEGSRFPSENDLALRFEINKTTANRIVSCLVADGYLKRCGLGAGTRVLKEELFPRGQIAFIGALPAYHNAQILQGASDYALKKKYVVSLIMPPGYQLGRCLKMLPGSPFKGILTCSYDVVESPDGIPVIHIDQDFPESDRIHHAVNSENYTGAYQMMRKILENGHREIVMFASDREKMHCGKHIRGYVDAMRESGIPEPEKRIFYALDGTQQSVNMVFLKILEKYPAVTVIATESDNDVIQFHTALMTHAPERRKQIVFTGFGNVAGLHKRFDFATVDQHFSQLGALATEKMIQMIENGVPEQVLREYVPCELLNTGCLHLR